MNSIETGRFNINIYNGIVDLISKIIEIRDPYTLGHEKRVSQLSCAIAKKFKLSQEDISLIKIAGIIHDIGKIAIPAEILGKPGKLATYEFSVIKEHTIIGYEIIKSTKLKKFMGPIANSILQHHEKIDGSGYPHGLKSNMITFPAKIIAVADVVEAMTFHRPYRPALGIKTALKEISNKKNIFYDSRVVDVCLNLFETKKFQFS
jgi:putative nucleotidyltransferase with HDIG domain